LAHFTELVAVRLEAVTVMRVMDLPEVAVAAVAAAIQDYLLAVLACLGKALMVGLGCHRVLVVVAVEPQRSAQTLRAM
jgi:hypothetical protein